MSRMTREKGFTLVELLVVISIIALLVSILLPSLSKARESAKKAVCLSNLKNLHLGLYMYVDENGTLPYSVHAVMPDNVPPDGWWYTDPVAGTPAISPWYGFIWFWQQTAGQYFDNAWDIYRCPASRCPAPLDTGRRDAPYGGNYGANGNLMPWKNTLGPVPEKPKKIDSIESPSTVAMTFDSGGEMMSYYTANHPHGYRWYIPG